MATPLCDALTAYTALDRCSYHTPGHKGQAPFLERMTSLAWDLTELPETGSLYDGGDVIEEAEKQAATVFGAAVTAFSAGGCTLCMQTMLALAAERGRTVLMGRNAHRSAVHAAALLDLELVWSLNLSPEAVETVLASDPTVKTVYVTSPDYYGRLADIRGLSAVCRRCGAALIVDNAHGTHLKAFGLHPLDLGADMTADSAHKTLPVLTGGAYLHIARDGLFADVPRERVKSLMGLFGSTSPAFPVLASLDAAQDWFETAGKAAFVDLVERLRPIRETIERAGLSPRFEAVDPVRITLDAGDRAASLAAWLRSRGIEAEYADERYVVLLVSPFHTDEQLHDLRQTLEAVDLSTLESSTPSPFSARMPDALPRRMMRLREAVLAPHEAVAPRDAVGRISAQTICPCPPGVAIVV
ncbi:MAG: aminotransferase class V-fold PLP-dependent enzyme, partial [Clostridia bacterium]|nr:aminotransferase class V-fold PLP-dependent enzyme [Clostridia bacterium]